MKFGIRTPSLKKRLSARTSWKRIVRHNLGLKAPRGWGWVTNPKKAAYNRVYNRTSISVDRLFAGGSKRSHSRNSSTTSLSGFVFFVGMMFVVYLLGAVVSKLTPLQILLAAAVVLVSLPAAFFWFKKKQEAEIKARGEAIKAQEAETRAREEATRQSKANELEARFGAENAQRVQNSELWQGATSEMVYEMFGSPVQVDEKALKTKTKATYKYFQIGQNRFALRIMFDDGVVVKWEDKRK